MKWFMAAMRQYAVFSGRTSRKGYWMFFLFSMLIALALGFVAGLLQGATGLPFALIVNLFPLALFIPSFSIAVRRMHDIDRSGWWIFVPILNLVFLCLKGSEGENRFGAEPAQG